MTSSRRTADGHRHRRHPDRLAADLARIRRKAHRVAQVLHDAYGSPDHDNKPDPLDELVFIVLSQMTTGPSFGRVYDRLKATVGTWDRLRTSPLDRVVELIQGAGLSRQKGPRLKEILERVHADFGAPTLEPLRDLPDAAVEAYLTSLPGVGAKTAKCVMMYSLGRDVLPVDTHVWRVARRVGLVSTHVPYDRVHVALERVVRSADRYAFHVNAIAHGRAVCLDRYPRCAECCLRRTCDTGRGAGSVATSGGQVQTSAPSGTQRPSVYSRGAEDE